MLSETRGHGGTTVQGCQGNRETWSSPRWRSLPLKADEHHECSDPCLTYHAGSNSSVIYSVTQPERAMRPATAQKTAVPLCDATAFTSLQVTHLPQSPLPFNHREPARDSVRGKAGEHQRHFKNTQSGGFTNGRFQHRVLCTQTVHEHSS